ncbi:hypothetical protein L249_5076 [Ophiocordyceps polyrhachis-furcata BCC 54312]|uniref:COP9 signalosome complex subunit 3 N-terminal helical repeats domain-containing protein n=1 Tax=Ophiocordyceps polyrhachis-furcata BCC 54312 TaxID=1330021 RepID=A0A367L3I0_9HYPO|nr:hypothetical protein L249_5076 [Ophiocordyceps polyrhachis-furcata BCC 54312]
MDDAKLVLGSFPAGALDADDSAWKKYDTALRQYASATLKLSREARAAVLADPVPFLQMLDPAKNTIGNLVLLDILYSDDAELPSQVLERTVEFLRNFDPRQVTYVGGLLLSLLERIGSGKILPPDLSVELLASTIMRLNQVSLFTSTHLMLAKLAHATNASEQALPVLKASVVFYPTVFTPRDVRHVLCDPEPLYSSSNSTKSAPLTDPLRSTTVMEYNLLRGLIYISREDWGRAQDAFEQVLTHPCRNKNVGIMMADAYKKWLLVGLLYRGRAPVFSSLVSPAMQTNLTTVGEPYSGLASLFSTTRVADLRTKFETHRQTWQMDGNMSLVEEVMSAYQKWQIKKLKYIYTRVPLSEVQRTTLDAETGKPLADVQTTEALVRSMIASGTLGGEIEPAADGGESYLAFGSPMASMTEEDVALVINKSWKSVSELREAYLSTDQRLKWNTDFVRHAAREQKRAEVEKEADAAVGFETQVEDEDLMTGVLASA